METSAQSEPTGDQGMQIGESQTVLVVDDDPDITDELGELLESEGYGVAAAPNGLAALGQLRRGLRPCVILLDLMMPVMDGWDFRAQQLKDPELRDIPVVIITAAGFSEASVKAQFGDIAFVPKPPPADGLLATVKRLCRSAAT
jgi:CheY-like chemotaxis protein